MVALRKGAIKRLTREQNERIRVAHLTAKLTAYAPAKASGFVKVDVLLIQDDRPRPRQTWQQQQALLDRW